MSAWTAEIHFHAHPGSYMTTSDKYSISVSDSISELRLSFVEIGIAMWEHITLFFCTVVFYLLTFYVGMKL